MSRDATVRSYSAPQACVRSRWLAEEQLRYDRLANELHRSSCPRAPAICEELAPGDALELVWAPRMCSCRPDVTLGLSHDPATG